MRIRFTLILILAISATIFGSSYFYSYLIQKERLSKIDMRLLFFSERLQEVDFSDQSKKELNEADDLMQDLKSAGLVWVWQKSQFIKMGGASRYADEVQSLCHHPGWMGHSIKDAYVRCLSLGDGKASPKILVASIMGHGLEPFYFSSNFYFYYSILIVVAILISGALSHWIFKPLEDLRRMTVDFLEFVKNGEYLRGEKHLHIFPRKNKLDIFDDEFQSLVNQFSEFIKNISEILTDMNVRASQLAHEMNTPLAVIQSQIEELIQKSNGSHSSELSSLQNNVQHLGEFIKRYSSYTESQMSLLEPANLYSVDISELTCKIIYDLNQIYGNRVVCEVDPSTKRQLLDPVDFEHLMQNLVVNALKYSDAPAKVEVRISENLITIKDSGPGLSESVHKRIGTPFNRDDHKGTHPGSGLGLSICSAIAKKYHWRIEFINENGLKVLIRLHSDEFQTDEYRAGV